MTPYQRKLKGKSEQNVGRSRGGDRLIETVEGMPDSTTYEQPQNYNAQPAPEQVFPEGVESFFVTTPSQTETKNIEAPKLETPPESEYVNENIRCWYEQI